MDFRNVTHLFADDEWDGPVEQHEGFDPNGGSGPKPPKPPIDPPIDPKFKPIVDGNGCSVHVIGKTVSIYDANGKLLRQESIVDYTKSNILGEYASLDNFIRQWSAKDKKESIRRLCLVFFDDVAVEILCGVYAGVVQLLRYRDNIGTVSQKNRGHGMPECMRIDVGQIVAAGKVMEPAGDDHKVGNKLPSGKCWNQRVRAYP